MTASEWLNATIIEIDGQQYQLFREIRHCPLCDDERWGYWSERFSRWKCDGCATVFDYDARGL